MRESKRYNEINHDALKFFFNELNKSTTYENLYTHLKSKGHELAIHEGAQIKYLDENVLKIFNSIAIVSLKPEYFGALDHPEDKIYNILVANGDYDKIKRKLTNSYQMSDAAIASYYAVMRVESENSQKRRIEKEKQDKINKEEKSEERNNKSFQISERSYIWTKRGIWISVGLAAIQIVISVFDIWVKDNEHETTMIQQNSVQIEQNKKIIELLQSSKQKDTVIVNVKLPEKK